ncbi:hypothetical protein D3C78_1853990 [compost metagenome]
MQRADVIGCETNQFFLANVSQRVVVTFHHVFISSAPKANNPVAVIRIIIQQHDVIDFESMLREYGQLFFVLSTQSRQRALWAWLGYLNL